jgi:hypothetical protein
MTAGRNSLYTPELVEKAREYLTGYSSVGDLVPSIAGLACVLGITRETCYAWARDETKAEFSDILDQLMQRQERGLLNGGLGGEFNSSISKMMLTKHGYSDATKSEISGPDGGAIPVEIKRTIIDPKVA